MSEYILNEEDDLQCKIFVIMFKLKVFGGWSEYGDDSRDDSISK